MVWREISARAPASSTPVRAAADDHEGEERALLGAVRLALGGFVGAQQPGGGSPGVFGGSSAPGRTPPSLVAKYDRPAPAAR